ncbi:MAG: DUF421 domain-containing protein [Firmicutes bacterium]|jgi:uncharacterized membrane protein YcaP (DUF421 family)|nr:DUF421 domain-containing protein [Bacillota bacterium]
MIPAAIKTIIKTVFMYTFVLFVTRVMGKREIGQLAPFDLVVAIMIADLAAMPLEDKSIRIHEAILPIAVLAAAEILFAFITLKNTKARSLICGRSSVVVKNGRIEEATLRELRYNLDDLLAGLREKDVHNIQDVEFAILEGSGRLSVLMKSQARPVTPRDLGITTSYEGLPYPLILDGEVKYKYLDQLNLTMAWLKEELEKKGVTDPSDVLLATLDTSGELYIAKKEAAELKDLKTEE